MSDTTANLVLPLLLPAQAQKHVTHNEALQILDLLVQGSVQDADRSAPPADPLEGQRHLVGPSATGAWTGQEGRLAAWLGGGWLYLSPKAGWRLYDEAREDWLSFTGTAWIRAAEQDLQGASLGLNASADAVNVLAVAAPATLLTHAGEGHQLKVNKANSGATASLLFQSNWSGRAEMGLAGQDNFSVKVSADGASFTEALRFDGASGKASGAAITQSTQDTTAGRLMKVGDFGIGRPQAPSISNWEAGAGHVNGFIAGNPSATGTAPPQNGALRPGLIMMRDEAGLRRSLMLHNIGGAELACRAFEDDLPLEGWQRLYGEMNLLGTVSQSSGKPTGAVFERGSNANGHYRRYADGRLECRHILSSSASAGTVWTFPVEFFSAPVITVTAVSTALASAQLDAAPSTSQLSFSLRNASAARLAASCHLIAIGDWF